MYGSRFWLWYAVSTSYVSMQPQRHMPVAAASAAVAARGARAIFRLIANGVLYPVLRRGTLRPGLRNEPVTHAADGEQVPRMGGVVFDVPAQPHDEIIDGAGVGVLVQAPDLFEHVLTGNRAALVPDQVPQEIGFHKRQGENLAADAQFEQVEADRLAVEGKTVARRGLRQSERCFEPGAAAQETADARDENRELERFRQVVVRSGSEAAQHVLRMAARSEHQGRDELAGAAELLDNGKAVLAGQHHVQNEEIGRLSAIEEAGQGVLAGRRDLHRIAFFFQVVAQAVGQVLLVLHHQDARHHFAGNSRINVLPRPGPSLSTQTRPPCWRATVRTMKRPKPVPLTDDASGPGMR